jgi:enamine deaminase RidA (YjgF/YER057c/UK114 family)
MTAPQRHLVSTGSPYEPKIGFSRAVRVGNHITVSGTGSMDANGKTVGVGDAAVQTRRCLEIIRDAIQQAGGQLEHVVRTRIFLTRLEDWEKIAAVHGEFFSNIRPASTFVQVSGFLRPEWLVEIEADAIVPE